MTDEDCPADEVFSSTDEAVLDVLWADACREDDADDIGVPGDELRDDELLDTTLLDELLLNKEDDCMLDDDILVFTRLDELEVTAAELLNDDELLLARLETIVDDEDRTLAVEDVGLLEGPS